MKVIPALLLLITGCLIPLIFGLEAVLLVKLSYGLPLGTLLAAIAMISASLVSIFSSKSGTFLHRTGLVLLLLSVLWLPLGAYLSGNAALNFVHNAAASQFFWRFTAGLSVGLLIVLVWTGVTFILGRRAAS